MELQTDSQIGSGMPILELIPDSQNDLGLKDLRDLCLHKAETT